MVLGKQSTKLAAGLALLLAASSLGGCATKKFVRSEVGVVDSKVLATNGRVDSVEGVIRDHDGRLTAIDATAKDALGRADAAGKLAAGKFNYTVLLTDDAVKFPANGAKLSDEAQSRLTQLAEKLTSENKNVYVEIQGHTDSTEAERVGQQRAEAVRRFLTAHGVPLNRISSISFGSTEPVAPNKNRDGRAQNRRVVINVLS